MYREFSWRKCGRAPGDVLCYSVRTPHDDISPKHVFELSDISRPAVLLKTPGYRRRQRPGMSVKHLIEPLYEIGCNGRNVLRAFPKLRDAKAGPVDAMEQVHAEPSLGSVISEIPGGDADDAGV